LYPFKAYTEEKLLREFPDNTRNERSIRKLQTNFRHQFSWSWWCWSGRCITDT